MGQILHGSAKTTIAVREAIQRSQATVKELSEQYDLNPKTVMKWKNRGFVHDAPMGPKEVRIEAALRDVESLGYGAKILRDGKLVDLSHFDPERHHRAPASRGDYLNNFIFLPRSG